MSQIAINPKQVVTPVVTLAIIGAGIYFFVLKPIDPAPTASPTTITPTSQGANNSPSVNLNQPTSPVNKPNFLGNTGTQVTYSNNQIFIPESQVNDSQIHYFNLTLESTGKTIYFFIIKASDGTYRAAANACEVCYGAKKGFTQVGNLIRCENCQTTYTKDQIALEKGGCNPGPINPDVPVQNGQLVLDVADVESIAYLF